MKLNYSGQGSGAEGYVIIWEFWVRAENAARFEQIYGPAGEWAKFFARGEGYVRTMLCRDEETAGRYVTLDFWESAEAYQTFRRQNVEEYRAIDLRCEPLTERESHIGSFAIVG